jgi:hypothetical protein
MDFLDRILAECEDRDLQMTVVQGGGAIGADAIEGRSGSDVELITDSNYFISMPASANVGGISSGSGGTRR